MLPIVVIKTCSFLVSNDEQFEKKKNNATEEINQYENAESQSIAVDHFHHDDQNEEQSSAKEKQCPNPGLRITNSRAIQLITKSPKRMDATAERLIPKVREKLNVQPDT